MKSLVLNFGEKLSSEKFDEEMKISLPIPTMSGHCVTLWVQPLDGNKGRLTDKGNVLNDSWLSGTNFSQNFLNQIEDICHRYNLEFDVEKKEIFVEFPLNEIETYLHEFVGAYLSISAFARAKIYREFQGTVRVYIYDDKILGDVFRGGSFTDDYITVYGGVMIKNRKKFHFIVFKGKERKEIFFLEGNPFSNKEIPLKIAELARKNEEDLMVISIEELEGGMNDD